MKKMDVSDHVPPTFTVIPVGGSFIVNCPQELGSMGPVLPVVIVQSVCIVSFSPMWKWT